MPKRKPPKASDLLWTWFIDPWKREATPLRIENNIKAWYAAVQCNCLDIGVIYTQEYGPIDVWCDESGMYKEPPLARFKIGPHVVYGYALLFERAGENTASVSFDSDYLIAPLNLIFEHWEERIGTENYFEQMTRNIEWEDWCHAVGEPR